jgi:NAD(P)-dependent dehydrogenase (short-subunit alcohol dehydrogenase family)
LASKVAIVTGAARGLGAAFAEAYVREGAHVVVADADAAAAEDLCARLNGSLGQSGGSAIAVESDVSHRSSVDAMIADTVERYGRIDVLLNNAGVWRTLRRGPFWEIPSDEWDLVLSVNARGPFFCAAGVAGIMQQQRRGKIIFVGSSTVGLGQARSAAYVASKAALIGLMRCVARELGPYGCCANVIHPGLTDSGGMDPTVLEAASQARMIRRIEVPADLVGAAVFLASDESDFMTGQQLVIDGGQVLL